MSEGAGSVKLVICLQYSGTKLVAQGSNSLCTKAVRHNMGMLKIPVPKLKKIATFNRDRAQAYWIL